MITSQTVIVVEETEIVTVIATEVSDSEMSNERSFIVLPVYR